MSKKDSMYYQNITSNINLQGADLRGSGLKWTGLRPTDLQGAFQLWLDYLAREHPKKDGWDDAPEELVGCDK